MFDLFSKIEKPQVEAPYKISKWVEYWNSLEYVSKFKYGKESYLNVHRFLIAHKKYLIGICTQYPLSEDYQNKYNVKAVNNNSTLLKERTDEEMYQHIRRASLAFNPIYEPKNKEYIKGIGFFYTNYSKQWGNRSPFIEYVGNAPRKLDQFNADTAIEQLSDSEKFVLSHVIDMFKYWNNNQAISAKDNAFAATIAQALTKEWGNIPAGIESIDRYFGNKKLFMSSWSEYIKENGWNLMPLGALHPSKELWRKFINNVSNNIGIDVFSGKQKN